MEKGERRKRKWKRERKGGRGRESGGKTRRREKTSRQELAGSEVHSVPTTWKTWTE